jgi:predicted ferric reductase
MALQTTARTTKGRAATPAAKRPAAPPIVEPIPIPLGFRVVRVVAFASVSSILLLATLPMWAPSGPFLVPSLTPAGYLMLARMGGFVAYALLWLSMALGISISSKLARLWPGGPAAVDVHQYVSLLGIGFTLLHVLSLLGNAALGYTIASGLLPFSGSSYRPFWMGLAGKTGLYLMLVVGLSFFVRARLGHKLWRAIHSLSFVSFALALTHGMAAGTDTPSWWVFGFYIASMAILLALLAHRLWATRKTGKAGKAGKASKAPDVQAEM